VAASEIRARAQATVVVLISATPSGELAQEARRSRADAVVWKPDLRPQLLHELGRIAAIHRGADATLTADPEGDRRPI
jgi:CheY-like chemotaxis protein